MLKCWWRNKFVIYIYIYIYIYIGQNLLKIKQSESETDIKICQNIKPPTPTHIPSSVPLSTWGRLEDSATNSFYTFCYMLIVLKSFLWAKQNLTVFK